LVTFLLMPSSLGTDDIPAPIGSHLTKTEIKRLDELNTKYTTGQQLSSDEAAERDDLLNKSLGGAANQVPAKDDTGKLHGTLPTRKQWEKYDRSDLEQLLLDIDDSVEERARMKSTHPDLSKLPTHTKRLNDELELHRDIKKYLYGK